MLTPTTIRKSAERGPTDFGWLKSMHSFSFGEYHDAAHMGFRTLRVINEDRVAPGGGFPAHAHRDMEIFSYVLSGALEHKDSLGNARTLKPGQVQLMSAGSGVRHSEYNPSANEPVHFLQIWIEPAARGLKPSYTEWMPPAGPVKTTAKNLIISPDGRENSAIIHQDALVWHLKGAQGETLAHPLGASRGLWLQVMRGAFSVGGQTLHAGDGASFVAAGDYTFTSEDAASESLLFDLL